MQSLRSLLGIGGKKRREAEVIGADAAMALDTLTSAIESARKEGAPLSATMLQNERNRALQFGIAKIKAGPQNAQIKALINTAENMVKNFDTRINRLTKSVRGMPVGEATSRIGNDVELLGQKINETYQTAIILAPTLLGTNPVKAVQSNVFFTAVRDKEVSDYGTIYSELEKENQSVSLAFKTLMGQKFTILEEQMKARDVAAERLETAEQAVADARVQNALFEQMRQTGTTGKLTKEDVDFSIIVASIAALTSGDIEIADPVTPVTLLVSGGLEFGDPVESFIRGFGF